MAVTTNLLIEGVVVRTSKRELPATSERAALTFHNALIVGDDCLADVSIGRGVEVPVVGTPIRGRVEVNVYRSEDQVTLVEIFDTLTDDNKGGKN